MTIMCSIRACELKHVSAFLPAMPESVGASQAVYLFVSGDSMGSVAMDWMPSLTRAVALLGTPAAEKPRTASFIDTLCMVLQCNAAGPLTRLLAKHDMKLLQSVWRRCSHNVYVTEQSLYLDWPLADYA